MDLSFGVAYNSDLDKVKEVILRVATSHEKTLKEPAPVVLVSAYKDSAIELTLRFWCNNADYWACYFDVNENMKQAFDAAGITIPFPQLDVHTY